MKLEHRWNKLVKLRAWDHEVSKAIFENLSDLYNSPTRHYHNWNHIEACLAHFDRLDEKTASPEIEIAVWFHDAIYDPQKFDNEAQSAQLAREELKVLKEDSLIDPVASLIQSTDHQSSPQTPSEEIIIDIDLSTLCAERDDYVLYAQSIRLEYEWVSEQEYGPGRIRVLNQFLEKGPIYRSVLFGATEEKQARDNLEWEISQLGDSQF